MAGSSSDLQAKLDKVRKNLEGKLTPVDDVVIAVKVVEDKTAGGILLPEQDPTGKISRRAYVLAVGPGSPYELHPGERKPMPCKAGDWILVSGFSGLQLGEAARHLLGSDLFGSEFYLMRSSDVLCVVAD